MKTPEMCLQVIADDTLLLQKAAELLVQEVLGGKLPSMEDELEVVSGREVMAITRDETPLSVCTFTLGHRAHQDGRTFTYLSLLATAPEERGHGYARSLIEHLTRVSREWGDEYIQVVPSHNSSEYYRRLGFARTVPGVMALEIST